MLAIAHTKNLHIQNFILCRLGIEAFTTRSGCDTVRVIHVSDSVDPILHELFLRPLLRLLHFWLHASWRCWKGARATLYTLHKNSGRILGLRSGTVEKEGHQSFIMVLRICFIRRINVGNLSPESIKVGHLDRVKQRSSSSTLHWLHKKTGHPHLCKLRDNYVCRLQVNSTPNTSNIAGSNSMVEFISRHSMDGKFSVVDQRVLVLWYPQNSGRVVMSSSNQKIKSI